MRKTIVGVMGPGEQATPQDLKYAYELGQFIAREGWILLTGGRQVGVMDAANRGAKATGGLTVGILPGKDTVGMSESVDIAILTDMGNARNNINVLTSDVVIACGIGLGTVSEIALALKNEKTVICLIKNSECQALFTNLNPKNLFFVNTPQEVIHLVKKILLSIQK